MEDSGGAKGPKTLDPTVVPPSDEKRRILDLFRN
jgi:hypothetical protein